jgi:hypothetical protein
VNDLAAAIAAKLAPSAPDWLADAGVPPTDTATLLDDLDARILALAGLIDDDIRFGALFAQLQEPLVARRPCIGLAGWLLADDETDAQDVRARCHELVASGLLRVDNPGDPRAEWVLRLPVAVWEVLRFGRPSATGLPDGLRLLPRESFPPLVDVVVPAARRDTVDRLPQLVRGGRVSAVVLRGMRGSGRLTVLGSVARELGWDVLVHDSTIGDEAWQLLAPLAALAGAMPVVRADPPPGQTLTLPTQLGLDRPLGVTVGRSGGIGGPVTERALAVDLGVCTAEQRRRLWTSGGESLDGANLDAVTRSFVLTPGTVRRVAPLAAAVAEAEGRDRVRPEDVRTAAGTVLRQSLETLATRLDPLATDAGALLDPLAAAELDALVTRCTQRERLAAATGPALRGTLNRGVRALFTGPSGTGKTLAARTVAARLHLDLYRVDLAAVVTKYIGETERNLDEVLGRAEELGIVLLLDEGDALMTRRTDVGNANDRYANLETNFLLQRLETFEGIAIVTTNAGNRIDTAFARRIDVTVDFTPPDADLRLRLWHAHLPEAGRVDPAVLADLARRCALTGGQIRNAALHAALLALDRDEPVGDGDVLTAVHREYRRMGAAPPLSRRAR